jgi:hypothetical protein
MSCQLWRGSGPAEYARTTFGCQTSDQADCIHKFFVHPTPQNWFFWTNEFDPVRVPATYTYTPEFTAIFASHWYQAQAISSEVIHSKLQAVYIFMEAGRVWSPVGVVLAFSAKLPWN